MLEVKSEKMVKFFFPKFFLDDLGGVGSPWPPLSISSWKHTSVRATITSVSSIDAVDNKPESIN
jgi:hypothetical protein